MEIWRFLIENDNGITNFHFEIAGDIMSAEELELLNEARPGQFQFEIGVQSTNRKTLCEIDRVTDIAQIGKKRSGDQTVRQHTYTSRSDSRIALRGLYQFFAFI